MMNVKLTRVTPEMASVMLCRNGANRRINERHVAFLSNQMKNGEWSLNGQTIVVDREGNLLDGQHRLSAVVRSGEAIEMLLCSGANPEVMPTIDTGRSRSAADVLKMNGFKHYNLLAASTKILYNLDQDLIRTRPVLSNLDILNTAPQIDNIIGIDWLGAHSERLRRSTTMSASCIMAALYLLAVKYGKGNVEEFIIKVNDGGDYEGSPTHVMATVFSRRRVKGGVMNRLYPFVLIILAFEKWVSREKLYYIKDGFIDKHLNSISERYDSIINWD